LFPASFKGVTRQRFKGREQLLENDLYPMLKAGDRPSLHDLIEGAEQFVSRFVVPRVSEEEEYLERFAAAEYRPDLLFYEWPSVLKAAELSPSAQWKLMNLRKMIGVDRVKGSFIKPEFGSSIVGQY
jgi:hypothetical protein